MHKKILAITIPLIISNVSVPLLGLINIGLMGNLGSFHYLAAIGIGVMIFNVLFSTLYFLRMGTTGFTAHAFGKNDFSLLLEVLLRAITVSIALGILLILLLPIILWVGLHVIHTSVDIHRYVAQYVRMRIFCAPATLLNFAVIGFFIGVQKARLALFAALFSNVIAIISGIILVRGLHFAIIGVVLSDIMSQYSAALLGLFFCWTYFRKVDGLTFSWKSMCSIISLKRYFYGPVEI